MNPKVDSRSRSIITPRNSLVIFAAASALCIAAPSLSRAQNTWTAGAGDMLWSSAPNWSFGIVPQPADSVLFDNLNAAVASGVVDNIVNNNFTIATLSYRTPSTLGFHTTQINPGLSLNIVGNSVTPSIFVGTGASFTGAINIYDRFVGGGALNVTNNLGAINASQGGDNNDHFATLDLSGLTNFSASVSQILVGCIGDNTAQGVRPMGILRLADISFIQTVAGVNQPGILIAAYPTGDTALRGTQQMFLGRNNTINSDTIIVGATKSTGQILSRPGITNGTAVLRGSAGGIDKVKIMAIGDGRAGMSNFIAGGTSVGSTGTFDATGTALDGLVQELYVARSQTNNNGATVGTFTFDQGSLTVDNVFVGWHPSPAASTGTYNGTGTININGSAILNVNNDLVLSRKLGGQTPVATLNLSSNALVAVKGNIVTSNGTSTINLNNAGTIDLQPAGDPTPGYLSVGTITGSGQITNAANVTNTVALTPGTATTAATLTIGNNLTMAANATLNVNLLNTPGAGNDLVNVYGNLNLNNNPVVIVPLSSGLANGSYTLMNYTGARNGSFSFANPTRYTATLSYPANQVNLDVSGTPGSVRWNSNTNATWDLTTSNWFNTGSAASDRFMQLDNVLVDDSVTVTNTLLLTTTLFPNSVTVNSSTRDYTFGGSGKLSGAASLAKNGTSMLTLSNANDFTGNVLVNAGTLRVINATALGTTNGTTTIASGGTLDVFGTSLFSPGEFITIAGTGVNNVGAIINTGAAQNNGIRYLSLSDNATIRGDNRFDVRGPNGSASFSGVLNLNGFTLTKLGAAQQSIVDTVATSAGNIVIGGGILGLTRSQIDGAGYIDVLTNVLLFENSSTGYLAKAISVGSAGLGGTIRVLGNALGINVPLTNISGLTVDNAVAFTMSNVISGAGSLTKIAAGTLTLSAANTYTGPTTVSVGRLTLTNGGSIATTPRITVAAGASFDVSGVIGGFTLGAGQTLSGSGAILGDVNTTAGGTIIPGSSPGTISFNNNLTFNSVTNLVELGSDPSQIGNNANDLIAVSGNLTLNGVSTIKIIPIAPLVSGTPYTVLTYGGLLSGGAGNLVVTSDNPRYVFSLVDPATTPGLIQVTVSGVPTTLVWKGGASGNPNAWDSATANWLNAGSADNFFSGDNVQFDDSATTPLVNLAATEQSGSVTINNNSLAYNIAGSGSLVAGSLTKQGTASLTIRNTSANSIAAGVAIASGPVTFTNLGANTFGLGSPVSITNGSLTFQNSGSDDFGAGLVIEGGTVTVANAVSNSFGGGVALDAGSLVMNQPVNAAIPVPISDTGIGGSLVKQGANTLTLSGNNINYNGPILVSSGMLRAANANALGNANGGTTIADGATLDLNGSALYNPGDMVVIYGAGLNNTGAVVNTGAAQQNGLRSLVLSNDASIASWTSANRWDVRGNAGAGSLSGSLILNGFTLTKMGVGTNSVVDADVSSPGSIYVSSGAFQITRCLVDGPGIINITNNLLVFENNSSGTVNKPIVSSGGSIRLLGNTFTVNSPITNLAGVTMDVASGLGLTDSGTILGPGAYNKISAGTNILTAIDNAWSQSTTIAAGTLQIGDGANDGSLPDLPITDNGFLLFNTLNDLAVTQPITGSGGVAIIAGGTVTLTASNSYAGQTTINSTTASAPSGAALRISNSYALGTAAGNTHIAGNTTGNGRLELVGNITVPESLQVDCRQSGTINIPAVLNVSGNNAITGPVFGNTGGSDMNFQSDSGKLTMSGSFNCVNTAGTRRLKLMGVAQGEWSGIISNSPDNTTALTILIKTNSGTWTLSANNIYGGATIVAEGALVLAATGSISNSATLDVRGGAVLDVSAVPTFTLAPGQTLKGNGNVTGSVRAGSGSTVSAGESVGILTVSGPLTLQAGSTTIFEIDKLNVTNDLVSASSITYGGTLVVNEISGTQPVMGDVFKLFSASSYSGSFTATTLPALDPSLGWDLSKLTVDGTIRVGSGVNTGRTNLTYSVSGGNLTLAWPADHTGWTLQVQTNHLSLGVSTNAADWSAVPGSTTVNQVTVPLDSSKPSVFYRLVYP